MVLITPVPRPPHPMIPIRMAEFALDPKATAGETIVIIEASPACLANVRRAILFIVVGALVISYGYITNIQNPIGD